RTRLVTRRVFKLYFPAWDILSRRPLLREGGIHAEPTSTATPLIGAWSTSGGCHQLKPPTRLSSADPVDRFEQLAQAAALSAVDHFDESDPSLQMGAEIRHLAAILESRAEPHTIGQNCFQSLALTARHTELLVHNHAGQPLPVSLPHDACLAMVEAESFLQCD